jgi:hypothetical protein
MFGVCCPEERSIVQHYYEIVELNKKREARSKNSWTLTQLSNKDVLRASLSHKSIEGFAYLKRNE